MINLLKDLVLKVITKAIVPFVEEVSVRAGLTQSSQGVIRTLRIRAVESSADYAQQRMNSALAFPNKAELWRHVCDEEFKTGIKLEFGVSGGESIRYFSRSFDEIYGFDSFEGLQENWTGTGLSKGVFDRKGKLPKVPRNVVLVKGWFKDTLPNFLSSHPQDLSFCHLDADTYESTKYVLGQLGERIKPGTIMIFDEYFCYNGWQLGEYRAWQEFVTEFGISYDYLAFTHMSVAIKIL